MFRAPTDLVKMLKAYVLSGKKSLNVIDFDAFDPARNLHLKVHSAKTTTKRRNVENKGKIF